MELDIIKLRTTWNDAAGSINSNYAKIADAIDQLKANGGGGGGGADIDLTDYATKVWVEAKGYITASALTQYALKEDIPSLVGYATEDFVNNKLGDYATQDYVTTKLGNYAPLTSVQGFENRIGGLEGAVPQLNARVETVESKVATLNEYVVTGDNNLLNRVNVIEQEYATKTYVDNAIDGIDLSVYLLKADLTKSRIQSTLGISDWALASVKPTYTAREVGALSVSNELNSGSLNDYTTAGIYRFNSISDGSERMRPYGNLLVVRGGTLDTLAQLYFNYYDGKAFIRSSNTSGLSSANWNTIAFTSDIPTKLSQLTDDVVAGRYLRSTIYGIGWDADSLYDAGVYSGDISHLPSGFPYGVIYTLPYRKGLGNTKPDYAAQIFIPCGDDSTSPNDMFFRTSLADAWNAWNKAITDKNIGNYNAGSADILATSFRENINYTSGESSLKLVRYVSDWESNGFPANYSAGLSVMTNYTGWQLLSYGGNTENPYFRSVKDDGVWKAWRQIAFLTDNVASATKLQTPRKLWGKGFDGTADVNGHFVSTGENGGFALYSGIRHNEALSIERLSASGTWLGLGITLNLDGYVGIGTVYPSEKLEVNGNIKTNAITIGGVTLSWDSVNNALVVNGNMYGTGSITAKKSA